jgi:hypothetical protein
MTIYEFATHYRLHVKRDPADGTLVILGRKGRSHLFEYGEGLLGVLVMPNAGTAHWWSAARAAFLSAAMHITQDCDGEGVATFDPENPEQVRLALKYADVKRRRRGSGTAAPHPDRVQEVAAGDCARFAGRARQH